MKKPYEVGYKKPPAAHRFQPETSGNSKGRKVGSENMSTLIRRSLDEKVVVNVNGLDPVIGDRQHRKSPQDAVTCNQGEAECNHIITTGEPGEVTHFTFHNGPTVVKTPRGDVYIK